MKQKFDSLFSSILFMLLGNLYFTVPGGIASCTRELRLESEDVAYLIIVNLTYHGIIFSRDRKSVV